MASVARAIEQAASKSVSGDLWWDSHTALFYALDKCGSVDAPASCDRDSEGFSNSATQQQSEGDARLAQKLKAHHGWLLNTLTYFKAPNATSKAALSTSRVDVGSHSLEVKAELRDLALQVSSHLVLDEVQAYILLSRYIEGGALVPFSADRTFLQALSMNYYVERQCLLKCTRLLLTFQVADEGEALSSYKAMCTEVKQLLEDGLEDKTLGNLKDHLAAVQPHHLDRDYTDFWAEETTLEQTLLLDILFLLYYEPLYSCKAARLKELLKMFQVSQSNVGRSFSVLPALSSSGQSLQLMEMLFLTLHFLVPQETIFGCSYGERLAFTPEAERCVMHVRQQAVLILIEALDLEKLLLMVHDEASFSQGGHAFSVEEVQELDNLIANLNPAEAREYAPLLLGWATFLCLVSFLPSHNGQARLQDVDLSAYVRQAYDGGAYSYLLEMLRSESFQESDVQVGGYKSVVKTLTAAFLAAYDSASQLEYDGSDLLINIFCEIYRGQESLCLELWDRESVIDGPIRSLLFSLRENFPYHTLSLVRLLGAQCKGSWPAECVYDFLYKMVKITSLYQHPEGSVMLDRTDMVQTNVALQVPDAPGLLIPQGTYGRILKVVDGRVSLVHWECEHSGIVVLLLRMLQRSATGYQLEEVHASLELLQHMLSSNKVLAQLLLDLDIAVATVTARADGRMASSLRIDVVGMMCAIINGLVQNGGDDAMLSSCLHILGSFALCSPQQVTVDLSRTTLLQPSGSSIGGVGVFAGSLLQVQLLKTEQSSGDYPLALAALDLTKILVEKGIESEVLSSLVMYIVRDLFVNHGNWRYQQPHQRWQITTQSINVALAIVTRTASKTSSGILRRGVLEAFLFDSIIHDVLLQLLAIGPTLEDLHFNRAVRPRELEWVQHALHAVLLLLHHVILDVTVGLASKDYSGMSMLEHCLLHKFAGPLPVIAVMTSFLSFSWNVDMQLASAKALTSLFVSAQKARPHPISIASYISSSDQRKALRTVVSQLLSEGSWSANHGLFDAMMDLLITAVKWQPAVMELLLFPNEQPQATSGGTSTTSSRQPSTSSAHEDGSTEGLDMLWDLLLKSSGLVKSHPHILSRALFLLATLWQCGIEYLRIIENFRQRPNFWKTITSGLSFSSGLTSSPVPTLGHDVSAFNKQDMLAQAFRYRCEASVLSIMACDIFLQQFLLYPASSDSPPTGATQLNGQSSSEMTAATNLAVAKFPTSSKAGGLQIISEWARVSATSSILKSYAFCSYDQEVLLRAKAEARVLVVGLMRKILAGDTRGLSATLSDHLQQAITEVLQLPSFEELVGQYTLRGYSSGKQLQNMLLSDLYHHLQGELQGGRPVPSGPFQQIAGFLMTKETDILAPKGRNPPLDGLHPAYGDGFVYDTVALEADLGIEWWPHSELRTLPSSVVDTTFSCMRRANCMASLGHSQLSALRAWAGVLTVCIFNKHGARGELVSSELQWKDEDVDNCTEELCNALGAAVVAMGPLRDVPNLIPSFMTMQAHLLLLFVRWLSDRAAPPSPERPRLWAVCAKVVRTTVGCLKFHLDSHVVFRQQGEELGKGLLGALIIALELMYSQNGGRIEHSEESTGQVGQDIGDALADVTLVGLGFLPLLSAAVEHPSYCSLALSGINLLIKGFLAPTAWLPVLQNHFPTRCLLGRMHADLGSESPKVALSMCLSLARGRGGAEMLQNAGFFSHLLTLSKQFQEENKSISGNMEGPFSVWPNQDQSKEGQLWSLQLAIVTALLRFSGDKGMGGAVVESALTYVEALKEPLLSALRAPVPVLDTQGRKKAKLQQPRTTLSALKEVQHVVIMLNELALHYQSWVRAAPQSMSEFGEMSLHLLAYISREGLIRPGVYHSTHIGVCCHPVQKEDITSNSRPSIIRSSAGWFAVCARGCTVKEGDKAPATPFQTTHSLMSASPVRIGSPSSPGSTLLGNSGGSVTSVVSLSCTEYSDMVAISVYRLVLLLLKFICKQVQHAVERLEDRGISDYGHFPQLPAPEVLYSLQDQVGAVVTEVLRTRQGKVAEPAVQDVCILLLSVLEKSLYLGVCVNRTCGLTPHPLRADDFGKEYRSLLTAAQTHRFLEAPLQSLQPIVALAYPEIG